MPTVVVRKYSKSKQGQTYDDDDNGDDAAYDFDYD